MESAVLVKNARELLRDGQPAKAQALLRRARSQDSTQLEVDRLFVQCQSQLGGWVPAQGMSDWMPGDDRLDRAVREHPDSVHRSIPSLVAEEDLAGAVRVAWALSRSHASDTGYLRTYRDLRSRQEAKIAFHRDLAQKASSRGDIGEALGQWRMAYAARPEDPVLRDMLEHAEQTWELALKAYSTGLSNALAVRDQPLAFDLARKGRLLFPEHDRFRSVFDSLDTLRRKTREFELERVQALADQGRDREAMEAMEALVEVDPLEPALVLAQSLLQTRIQKRRKQTALAELARSFDDAVQAGDLSKAEAVFADLRRIGLEGFDSELFSRRLDSLRGAERGASAFNEAMVAARTFLRAGDFAAARGQLQKALSLQPGNAMAKGLLASLANAKPPVAPVAAPVAQRPAASAASKDHDVEKAKELLLAGVTAYRAGEYDRAVASWKRVLELDSGNVQARKYLANVGLKQTRLK